MKFKVKSLQKPTVTAAAFLLGANVVLDVTTGHREGVVALARVATYAGLALLSAPLWAWVIGRKVPLFYTAYKALVGVVRKALTAPATQVVVGGLVAVGWTGALASNAWTLVRPGARWMAPLDVFTNPGDAFATGGGVLGGIALAIAATIAMLLMKKRAKNRPDTDDVHGTPLEKLLAPTIGQVAHLLVEPGSLAEVTRPYLCDALVQRKRLHGLYTTYCLVPLYLADAACGIGVFGPPGMGKDANSVANTVLRPGGPRTAYDDGHGLGRSCPQILISTKGDIASSLKFRVTVARAALRQANDGAEPTHEQVRELVSVYDPTGACARHPDLAPYCKGWSPLASVCDHESATKLAKGLFAAELNSNVANSKYFADNAVLLVTAMVLAAARSEAPLRQVTRWANEIAHANSRVPGTLAKILTRPGADLEDVAAHDAFNGVYATLKNGGDGERSAIWGLVRTTLAPFTGASVAASTNPDDNLAMVDCTSAVTTPYSVLYVLMPARPSELDSMRPVFTAFLEELIDRALFEASRFGTMDARLPAGLQITINELESTLCFPKLPKYLAQFRSMNIKILWLTQTFGGLAAGYSQDQMDAIVGNSGAVLTYAGYGATDAHIKRIVEEIGARTVNRVSHSKRGGEDAGSSSSKDRVQLVDVARLKSELHADKMIIQTAGATSGTAADREQLRPFIGRQHRSAASKDEKAAGWWVDPVTFARLEKGTAEGVVAHDRPSDRRWVRPIQRLYDSLAARVRRPRSEPDTA